MSLKNYSLGQVGDFEIKQLRIFKSVVDNEGFSAAETELNISRSTISIHISNLESRLNLTLCRRGRGGFALTDEGRVVYEMTNNLLQTLEEFRNVVNDLSSTPSGVLRIALSDGTSLDPRGRFPQMISDFCAKAPEITLQTDVAAMADIERMVLNDEVDIGIMPYHRKLEGIEYIHLYSDDCYLYCGQTNPLFALSKDELTDDVVNQYTAIEPGLKPNEQATEQLTHMSLKATAYFYETRLAMILSGKFIAFLPEALAQPYVDQELIKPIAKESRFYHLGVAAIVKKTTQPNKARELFMQSVHQTMNS